MRKNRGNKWIVIAIFLASLYYISFETTLIFGHKFEKSKWLRPTAAIPVDCIRDGMVRDIRKNVLPIGTQKKTALEKLGPPDRESSSKLEYILGECDLIDVDVLEIYFDKDGRVSRVNVKQH